MRAFRYQLPCARQIELKGRGLLVREGLLLESAAGWGDAAPLPGFSRETIDDALVAWQAGPPFREPSLRFAHESARAVLPSGSVPVAAMLAGPVNAILAAAQQLGNSDCQAIKLKVGRAARVSQDIELVRAVRRLLRGDQSLRLDANRAWDRDTAVAFGKAIAGLCIEYIEEPTRRPQDCEYFWHQTSCPYALDETLTEHDALDDFPHAAALVVKPTLLGGAADIDRLTEYNKPMVFSASFESGIGVLHVATLAARYAPGVPAGLDTYSFLDGDVLADRLAFDSWTLRLDQPVQVDLSKLEEVR